MHAERDRARRGGARRSGVVGVALLGVGLGAVLVAGPLWQAHVAAPSVPASSLDSLPSSPVTVSLVYEASPLIEELERSVPLRIGDLSQRLVHPSDPLIRYAYQADRTAFEVDVGQSSVVLTTVIEYGGRVWYRTPLGLELTAGCGASGGRDDRLRAVASFSSPIEIAEDWTVRPRVSIDRVEPLTTEDRCRVGAFGFSLDVTDAIMAEAERQLRTEADRIHRILSAIDLKPHVEAYWQAVREPIALGEEAWLTLEPTSLRHDGIEGTGPGGRTLRTRVSALTTPRIVLGPRPEITDQPLPSLERGAVRNSGEALVDGLAGFEGLSELLTRELQDEEIPVAGRALRIHSVDVTHAGVGRLAVEIDVDGGIEGRIHLTGTPVFDPDAGELTFPDLDFRVDSPSLLTRAYAWILRNAFPHRVREQVRFALEDLPSVERAFAGGSPSPDAGDGSVQLELGGQAYLESTLTDVHLVGLAVTSEGVLVRSRVDALTTVRVGEVGEE